MGIKYKIIHEHYFVLKPHFLIFVKYPLHAMPTLFVMQCVCLSQGKLQKHQAFEAEVQANSGAIVKLDETGNLMISEGHFACETIRVWAKTPPRNIICSLIFSQTHPLTLQPRLHLVF